MKIEFDKLDDLVIKPETEVEEVKLLNRFGDGGDAYIIHTGGTVPDGPLGTVDVGMELIVGVSHEYPCDHTGCDRHYSHPCEQCGRQWDKYGKVIYRKKRD